MTKQVPDRLTETPAVITGAKGQFDLTRAVWQRAPGDVSSAEIEVASLDLGDQIIAEWVGLLGITYDTGDDLIDVGLDNGSHLIRSPRTILIDEQQAGLASVTIETTDGTKQVVRLRDTMMLPPGVAAGAERGQGSRRR